MTGSDYTVGGCTALIDAIGGAIHHIGNIHKYAREEDQTDQLLAQAEAQIKARHYGEQNALGLVHVYMALVFSGKERRFVKYSVRIEA